MQPANSSAALSTLLADDWQFWMTSYPELATQFGFPGQNARWTDYSDDAIASRAAYLRATVGRLDAISREHLSVPDQPDYDLYRGAHRHGRRRTRVRQRRGADPRRHSAQPAHADESARRHRRRRAAIVSAMMPAESVADFEDLVSRLERRPGPRRADDRAHETGLERGFTPPLVSARAAARPHRRGRGWGAGRESDARAVHALPGRRSARPTARGCRTRPSHAFETVTRAGLRKAARVRLANEYLPACRETTGARRLPNGAAMYEYNVRWHTTRPETPPRSTRSASPRSQRIRAEMDARAARRPDSRALRRVRRFCARAPSSTSRTPRRCWPRIATSRSAPIRSWRICSAACRRRRTACSPCPDAVAPSQTTAYYEPGAFVGRPRRRTCSRTPTSSTRGRSGRWKRSRCTRPCPAIICRSRSRRSCEGLPEFRKNTSYTAYVEGWALYAGEPRRGDGLLPGSVREVRPAHLRDVARRAARRRHRPALDGLDARSRRSISSRRTRRRRVRTSPSRSIATSSGPARRSATRWASSRFASCAPAPSAQLGPRFDIRAFHDVVLDRARCRSTCSSGAWMSGWRRIGAERRASGGVLAGEMMCLHTTSG